jgi:hypothetical protein
MFRFSCSLSAVLALAAGAASAETIDKTVKANSRTAVGAFFTYWEGLCQASTVPQASVRSRPASGTLAIEVHQVTLSQQTRCPGARVSGPVFIYTPAKGFKGVDQFEIDIPFARVEERLPTVYTHTYRIRVE